MLPRKEIIFTRLSYEANPSDLNMLNIGQDGGFCRRNLYYILSRRQNFMIVAIRGSKRGQKMAQPHNQHVTIQSGPWIEDSRTFDGLSP